MKVVIVNNDFKAYWRARLLFLQRYLADEDVEFYAVELFGKGSPYKFDELSNTLPWWQCVFPDKEATDLNKYEVKKGLFKALNIINPDVVIGPSIVFYPGALGIAWAKHSHKKFIMFDDAKPSHIKRNFIVQGIKNIITSQSDSLWLPSKTYEQDWAYFKTKGVNFLYGFNTIDNKFFKPKQPFNPGNNTVVCVARLVPVKNIHSLLKAWHLVEQQQQGYQLQIIGNGPQEALLKKLAAKLGLVTVEFIDAVDNNQLPAYLSRSAAFILPSLSETWGLAVNEAMASGLPLLLSRNINAAADLLHYDVNGYDFEPENVEEISQVILKFINADGRAKMAMSAASLKIIESFTFEKMGGQLAYHLKWLVRQPFKSPGVLAAAIIKLWHGRYNTAVWDNVDRSKINK